MKKCIKLAAVLFAISVCAAPLYAQLQGSVRGTVKDQQGNPMAGAIVVFLNLETGAKYELKTNAKGEYSSIGIANGTYKATLIQNGTTVFEFNNIPVAVSQERVVDFDMAALAKAAQQGMTEEQKKKAESSQKEHEKIKSLNATLAQAKELEGAGNYDQAVTILQQATQAAPNQDLIWAYLGDAQRGAKKYPDAIDSYQKALAIKPNVGTYLAGLADAYAKSGQTDKAVEQYAAAAAADPANAATFYFNEGVVFTNHGKADEAITAFDKSIQLDPNRAAAYYLKGQELIAKSTTGKDGKMVAPEGTAEAFNKYLELEPNGKFADTAKQMLAMIGAPVETSYGKSKSGAKKK